MQVQVGRIRRFETKKQPFAINELNRDLTDAGQATGVVGILDRYVEVNVIGKIKATFENMNWKED